MLFDIDFIGKSGTTTVFRGEILSRVNHNMVFNRMKPVIICPSYSALRQAAGALLMTHLRFSDLFFIVLIMILASILAVPVLAQDTESGTIRQERATSGADEGEEETVEVDISEDTTPIGIVDQITLTGGSGRAPGLWPSNEECPLPSQSAFPRCVYRVTIPPAR